MSDAKCVQEVLVPLQVYLNKEKAKIRRIIRRIFAQFVKELLFSLGENGSSGTFSVK